MAQSTKKTASAQESKVTSNTGKALVFISHDTRDADIAEAFSKLLSSVSAGVLKSFRSSDRKGNQGIEYGVDWYPVIMKKLNEASDVVCLLTPFSVNRPWILYEAGVAKGQLETPVHGLALGIPLTDASTGPFAQFQNSDDTTDSIASMVMQLVSRIPNAEPDRDVVVAQVEAFKARITEIIEGQGHKIEKPKKFDNTSVAKLFEEVKVMYEELPRRIEARLGDMSPIRRRRLRGNPFIMIEEFTMFSDLEFNPYLGLVIYLSMYKDEFPYLYDLSYKLFNAKENEDYSQIERITKTLLAMSEMMRRHPFFREMHHSKEHYVLLRDLPEFLKHMAFINENQQKSKTDQSGVEQQGIRRKSSPKQSEGS